MAIAGGIPLAAWYAAREFQKELERLASMNFLDRVFWLVIPPRA